MNCEKCGAENAHFTGNSKSWGPDACEAENTPENLPGGYTWLCEDCDIEFWLEDCKNSNPSDDKLLRDWFRGIASREEISEIFGMETSAFLTGSKAKEIWLGLYGKSEDAWLSYLESMEAGAK